MAVKIRLTRVGKKRQPSYRVVVADSRSPRDGRYIEQIGRYDPTVDPSIVEIDNERAEYWMARGAKPSSQVRKLLEISGSLEARPLKDRRVHVVGEAAQSQGVAEAPPAVETVPEAPPVEEAAFEDIAAVEAAVEDKVVDMAGEAPEAIETEPVAEDEEEQS
jgi:small subunit ribosomal protein S16